MGNSCPAPRISSYNDCARTTLSAACAALKPRSVNNSTTCSGVPSAISRNSCATRSRISCAAFLVKVIAKICLGATPAMSSRMMREVSNHVLPLPAQARTTTLCAGSKAARVNSAKPTGALFFKYGVFIAPPLPHCHRSPPAHNPCDRPHDNRNTHTRSIRPKPAEARLRTSARILD